MKRKRYNMLVMIVYIIAGILGIALALGGAWLHREYQIGIMEEAIERSKNEY